MTRNNLLIGITWIGLLCASAIGEHSTGFDDDISIVEGIRVSGLNGAITSGEVVNAVYFYYSTLHPNNSGKLRLILSEIVAKRKLPKGSWLTKWEAKDDDGSHLAIFLEIGRDKQPADLVPEPGSTNQIVWIPIRVVEDKEEHPSLKDFEHPPVDGTQQDDL